jgi:hypothetical protein
MLSGGSRSSVEDQVPLLLTKTTAAYWEEINTIPFDQHGKVKVKSVRLWEFESLK